MDGSYFAIATWSATAPETGRYDDRPRTTPGADLLARFDDLRNRGAGHCEVEIEGQDYPWLTVSFQDNHAVVHIFFAEEDSALLGGDGILAAEDVVEVKFADDEYPSTFTGEFVSSLDRVESVLQQFLRGRAAESLGDWYNL